MKLKRLLFTLVILMVWSVFSLDANASGSYNVKHSGDDENAQIAAGIEWTVELADEDIYVADDLDYTVTMDAIEMDEGEYQFFVYYPQINYKDGHSAKEINKILKDKACFQMDNMYPEFKYNEDVDMGYYRSTVTYEISYMDNNLFSVVFYDEYFAGSMYAQFYDATSCVIDLNTKQEYQWEHVIDNNDKLTSNVFEMMLEKADSLVEAKKFNKNVVTELMEYGEAEDRYICDLLLLSGKLGIVFTYHYGDGTYLVRGYTIIELEQTEISDCMATSHMWESYLSSGTDDDVKTDIPSDEKEYIVKKGDCLYAIAREQLGNGYEYIKIMELNQLASTVIYPGQKLMLP